MQTPASTSMASRLRRVRGRRIGGEAEQESSGHLTLEVWEEMCLLVKTDNNHSIFDPLKHTCIYICVYVYTRA